jgi:hypothetical protein
MYNKFHSINIHKQHEIDFKLYTLTFKVGNTLQEHFEIKIIPIEIYFDDEFVILYNIYNKGPPIPIQKVNNQ